LNPDDAENELVRALLEPLPKTGYLTEAVRHMTAHARHRLPDGFVAACAETTEHFRAVKPPSPRGKTKLLLASLLGLAVAAAFIVPGAARRELKLLLVTQADQLPDHVFARLDGQTVIRERILSRVSQADGEILFGDLTAQKTEDRWKALAEREPTNPGRHADAALGYLKSNGKLPPDFIERGDELDPGNGWYAFFHGRTLIQGEALFTGKWANSVGYFFSAVAAHRFEDPTYATWKQRVDLLPEERLWSDVVAAARFMDREMPNPGYRFETGTEFIALERAAMKLSRTTERMKEPASAWLQLFEHVLRVARTRSELVSLLEFQSGGSSSRPRELGISLSNEGLADHATVMVELGKECELVLFAAGNEFWIPMSAVGILTSEPTSLLTASIGSIAPSDPALTRPGIAAEWAMHERLIGWVSVLLLGLLFLTHLAVLQSNRGFDRLAERLGQILRRSDYLLIFLSSLGLPLLLYAIATRLPGHGLLTMPLAQEMDPRFTLLAILHGAWILAVPLLALEATRWRLAVRGRALGMAGRGLHLGMVPLAMLLSTLIGATVLPAIPSVWADPKLPLLGLAGGLAIGALWLLVLIVWHFAAPRESFPERLLRLRVVLGPVLAALLVTAAGMVALREHERHLVSINRFEKSPRTHAGNPTAADQAFLETWKPRLLEAVRKAREDLEALE
jgi:hypothetical protein